MSKDSDILEQVAELLEDAYIFVQGEEHPIPNSTIQQIDQLYRKHYRERLVKIAEKCYEQEPHSDTVFGVNIGIERLSNAIKQELSDD